MSDENEDTRSEKVKAEIAKLKAQYGDLISVELEGHTLAFKRFTKAQLTDLRKRINSKPDLVIDLTINACEFQCVLGKEFFGELSNKYPIVFCGDYQTKGVSDYLMDLARGGADGPKITVE
jgi:hypothetical protein